MVTLFRRNIATDRGNTTIIRQMIPMFRENMVAIPRDRQVSRDDIGTARESRSIIRMWDKRSKSSWRMDRNLRLPR